MRYQTITPVNAHGNKFAFVPSGLGLRNSEQLSWFWRCSAEFEWCQKHGWNVGFITLTYDDMSIPRIPRVLFKNKCEIPKTLPPCFSRSDVKRLVVQLRRWIWKHYHAKSMRYIICSEYGEHTQRPHYHALFACPPNVDFRVFYAKIDKFWNHGFIIPKNYDGGTDLKGQIHKPFKIENVANSCFYCAKYVTKDLKFLEVLSKYDLDRKLKIFREIKPFHVQSRGLGSVVLQNMSNAQKMDLLQNGSRFLGMQLTRKNLPVPLYVRNKLLFDNYYVITTSGRRLCRREASLFYKTYYKDIFRQKVDFYCDFFKKMANLEFWSKRDIPLDCKHSLSIFLKSFRLQDCKQLATFYCSYFGVDYKFCYDVDPARVMLNKYLKNNELTKCRKIDYNYYLDSRNILSMLFSYLSLDSEKTEIERKRYISAIQDKFKSVTSECW